MTLWRQFAALLIVLPAAAIGAVSGQWLLSGVLSAAAAVGATGRLQWRVIGFRRMLSVLALAALFAIELRFDAIDTSDVSGFLSFGFAYALGMFLLSVMAFRLISPPPGGLGGGMILLGGMVLLCAGNVMSPTDAVEAAYRVCTLLYMVAAVGYASTMVAQRRVTAPARAKGRAIVCLIVISGSAAGGILAAGQIVEHQRTLARVFLQLDWSRTFRGPSVGFSDEATLSTVSDINATDGDKIALRIRGDQSPGYLRARAYEAYDNKSWGSHRPERDLPVEPDDGQTPPAGTGTLYLLSSLEPDGRTMEVWPARRIRRSLFLPTGACRLRMDAEGLSQDDHGAVKASESISLPYIVATAAGPDRLAPSAALADRLTDLSDIPPELELVLRKVAAEIFRPGQSPAERMAAVETYFHSNYEYHLGVYVPPDAEPLAYFLTHRPAAHCEYFASATTLLLRAGGVPARYVTGFVSDERARFGDWWLARNRDAHAWVEAWDADSEQWRLVEATPSAGVPGGRPPAGWLDGVIEQLGAWSQQIRAAFTAEGFAGLFRLLLEGLRGLAEWLVLTVWGWITIVVAVGWTVWRRVRRHRRREQRRAKLTDSPAVLAARALLAKMDRRARRRRWPRDPAETLHDFARRLAGQDAPEPAAWYRLYADLRFGRTLDDADVQALAEAIPAKDAWPAHKGSTS